MKNTLFYLLVVLVIFQGLSGLAGGIGLIGDPTGENLGIPLEWLAASPFNDYLIPGIVLFIVLGLYPLVAGVGLLKKTEWSLIAVKILGYALIIWLLVEIAVIGYQAEPPLQLIYGLVGIFILILAYTKSVKNILTVKA